MFPVDKAATLWLFASTVVHNREYMLIRSGTESRMFRARTVLAASYGMHPALFGALVVIAASGYLALVAWPDIKAGNFFNHGLQQR